MNRAYSVLEIKGIDDDARVLRGIASTPTPDRMDDIIEPRGASFTLPLPLLWHHDSRQPIGHVTKAEVTDDGIAIEATVAKAVTLAIDEAWAMIKAGLVRGLSIGFKPREVERIKGSVGVRHKSWEWVELSAVTIPTNAEASILNIKQFDAAAALTGPRGGDPPGISGKATIKPEGIKSMNAHVSLADKIASAQAIRTAKQRRIVDIMHESDGTLDEPTREEYDNLAAELRSLDEHLVRLMETERLEKAAAVPVEKALPATQQQRLVPSVQVIKPNLPKGTAFARYAQALMCSKGNLEIAHSMARTRPEWQNTPEVAEVLKAAVAAGTTTDATWAAPLVQYQAMQDEFIEFLRQATIVGRMGGLHRVPFLIKVPRQTAGASAGWVGEGAPKPLSKLAFDTVQLDQHKVAVIVVITEELARFSNPSAEALIRTDLTNAIAEFIDTQFLDPTKAAVGTTSPASITNGVTAATPSGTTPDDAYADTLGLITAFAVAKHRMLGMTWVMSPAMAAVLAGARNLVGGPLFNGLSAEGGTLHGYPVLVTTNLAAGANDIYLIETGEIMFADSGLVLDSSREASVQMSDTPMATPDATTVLVSLWQHNLVGIRAERFVTWKPRRSPVVQWIENAAYAL